MTSVLNNGLVLSRLCFYTLFKGCVSEHSLGCHLAIRHGVHFVSSVLTTKEIDELTLIQVIITPTNASQELIELLCGLLKKNPAMRLG